MISIAFWLPIISVVILYLARILELRANRRTSPGEVREKTTFRLFLLSGNLLLIGAVAEYLLRDLALRLPSFVAGCCVAAAAFAIRRAAIRALGRFWSLHIEIRDNHEFVQSGPFRWVRHPAYLSMILELLAVALILNAYLAFSAIGLLFLPTLWLRLKWEESALVEKFGEAYRGYQRETPALIPYKLPRPK